MSETSEFLEVQGTNGATIKLLVSAFKGMSKTKFKKKYQGRIIDLEIVFDKLEKLNKPKGSRSKRSKD
jgi:hypothetical protein